MNLEKEELFKNIFLINKSQKAEQQLKQPSSINPIEMNVKTLNEGRKVGHRLYSIYTGNPST